MEKIICKADIRPKPKKLIFVLWYLIQTIVFYSGSFYMNYSDYNHTDYYLYFMCFGVEYYKREERHINFFGTALFLGILITFFALFLPLIIRTVVKHIAANCSLELTEKGIIGNRKKLFSNVHLNLPIDKVDNIMISESIWDKLRGGKNVAIRSNSGLIRFPWVQNAEEFVNMTLEKIEEFKQSVKEENQKIVSAVSQNVSKSNNSAGETSSVAKIKELKSLLDDGLITQEEFDAKRKELLYKM